EDYKAFSELFDKDIYKAIELEKCVSKRNSRGGTSPQSVREQISIIKKLLSE
ncbi:MAG TPA: argininosuccinate lyase, partial [Clostridiales bacterium]|nr:argininosuccinate lyase [Clostridiales bacterium]